MADDCACCSGKSFMRCCGRFLVQQQAAKTAEQLMRSRFTAYALGGHGNYLMATWLNAEAMGLSAAQLSSSDYKWYRLEVLDKVQKGNQAEVGGAVHERSHRRSERYPADITGGDFAGGNFVSGDPQCVQKFDTRRIERRRQELDSMLLAVLEQCAMIFLRQLQGTQHVTLRLLTA